MPRSRRSASASPGRGRSNPSKTSKKSKHEESEEEHDASPTRSTRSHAKTLDNVESNRSRGRTDSMESPDNKRKARKDSKSPKAKKAKMTENTKKGRDMEKNKDKKGKKGSPKDKKSSPVRKKHHSGDDSTQKKARNSDSESGSEDDVLTPKSKNISKPKSTPDSKKKNATESSELEESDQESSDDDIVCIGEESGTPSKSKNKVGANRLNNSSSWNNSENDMYKALEWSGMARTRGSKREAMDKMCVSVALNMLNGGSDGYSDGDEHDVESVSDETRLSADSDIQEISDEEQDDDDEILVVQRNMHKLKEDYETILKEKNEKIERLKNEIKFKDEQLEEMNNLATKNMELEAKISYLLTDRKNYEKEVKEYERKMKEKDQEKEKIKSDPKNIEKEQQERERKPKEKGEETEKPKHGKAPKDEVMEVEIISELESPKRKPRKHVHSEEISSGDEENAKKSNQKRRRKGGKRGKKPKEKEDEGEDIDTLFVSDDEEEPEEKESKLKRKRDQKDEKKSSVSKSEEKADEGEDSSDDEKSGNKGRHNIRKLMGNKKLKEETKAAAKAEKERLERLERIKEQHFVVNEVDKKTKQLICTKLVLEFKKGGKIPLIEVNHKLVRKLKPHQVDAVQFLWDSVIESFDRLKSDEPSSGCILAHCMGLGKTLSVIAFVHTLMTHKILNFHTCLVVCPLNTVLNWQHEWTKWLDKKDRLKVHELASAKGNHDRAQRLQKWHNEGGIMIMGYQIFRILATSTTRSKKRKEIFETTLIKPGPDVVVCDEGHILKNDTSSISKCMNRIDSKRRIVLTGTPLQNNLIEYHCMVNFVKENLLGTRREFLNRFVNPITNGQHSDSTPRDVKIMKRRAHVLHEMLAGCVQRRDYAALTKFLPPKYEYVLSVRLSPRQMDMYQKYLDVFRGGGAGGSVPVVAKGAGLFQDFHNLMRVWTHPWLLKLDEIRQEKKALLEYDSEEDESFVDDESEEEAESTPTLDESEEESEEEDDDEESEKPSKRTTRGKKSQNNKKERNNKNSKENDTTKEDAAGASERDERQKRRTRVVAGEVIKEWGSTS